MQKGKAEKVVKRTKARATMMREGSTGTHGRGSPETKGSAETNRSMKTEQQALSIVTDIETGSKAEREDGPAHVSVYRALSDAVPRYDTISIDLLLRRLSEEMMLPVDEVQAPSRQLRLAVPKMRP
jgi:hypothetical protein